MRSPPLKPCAERRAVWWASQEEGGLDDTVEATIATARTAGVHVVFALTRTKMGLAIGRKSRMACAAVMDPNGADEAYAIILKQAALGREARAKPRTTLPSALMTLRWDLGY